MKFQVSKVNKSYLEHPKAHYLSIRTAEILKEIGIYQHLKKEVELNPFENWSHYNYCSYLLEENSYLASVNKFSPVIPIQNNSVTDEDYRKINKDSLSDFVINNSYLKYLLRISNNSIPLHIGQNKLNEILFNEVQKYSKYIKYDFNSKFLNYNNNEKKIEVNYLQNDIKRSEKYDYVIGCDGSTSSVRQQLGSKLVTNSQGKLNS